MNEDKVVPPEDLLERCIAVLKLNDRGNYTQPAPKLYAHQWLWDSCFTAIGLRHIDNDRAQLELSSLLRGQWHNGMLPNIIFRDEIQYRAQRDQWRSWLSPNAPNGVKTSGLTQPPMLAEAVVKVGAKMAWPERRRWYRLMYPSLLAYHQWLYRDRDPHSEGLVLLIHPWEAGLDNSPPWVAELHEHQMPLWIRLIEKLRLDFLINLLRVDTKTVPSAQRSAVGEALAMYSTQLRLRRKNYDINRVLDHALFSIEDLTFNSILVKANAQLEKIATALREDLPEEIKASIKKTRSALEELWDPLSGQYYSRDFVTHRLLKTPSIAALMPLYSGSISKERAGRLVKLLENDKQFGSAFPVPSVPVSSMWFDPVRYWQGPTWVNMNWLIIEGLKDYGFKDHADALRDSTIEMVQKGGIYEYFDPLNGAPYGASDFAWTAALTIDLLNSNKKSAVK
jgi:hypothetical protein